MYSVFSLSIHLFSKTSIHCSSYFSLVRSTPSSADLICQSATFRMLSVSESIIMANRKWLKADPWWRPTSTANGSLVSATHLPTVLH